MRNMMFALALAAGALTLAVPAGAATKCDSNGCWTVNCDASGNHCHRHWLDDRHRASQARYNQTAPADVPRPRPDCTPNGDYHRPSPVLARALRRMMRTRVEKG